MRIDETKEFGDYLRRKRKERYLSIKTLAQRTQIQASYLSDIERSQRLPPTPENLDTLSQVLDLDEIEKAKLYDYAAFARDHAVSPDIQPYIMENDNVRELIRFCIRHGYSDDWWGEQLAELKAIEKAKEEANKKTSKDADSNEEDVTSN